MSSTLGNTIDFDSARLKLGLPSAVHRVAAPRPRITDLPALQQRLAQMLQTSLELDRVLSMFFAQLAEHMALDELRFTHAAHNILLQNGKAATHRCNYRITHAGEYLGDIQFSRSKRFDGAELAQIESLMGILLYPLRNALLYHQAMQRALSDSLTGAGNRFALRHAMEREIPAAAGHARPLAMIIMDIDHFKAINDRYGHAGGDLALKAVVECMHGCLRSVDNLFRFGGEEFLVILGDTDCSAAAQVAERIRLAIEAMHFEIKDERLRMTISAGVAMLRENESGEALLDRCDQQLYRAKQNGRNCVVCC
ncbi:GGDEF domain-containing protein [Pseudomonas sp. OIL-1]|uniref:GGDEF domain-containing protein n=1 Tax=Pseudomonas sp. OIL-1 TaxID=2706126 RepID=UPI0013A71FEF|nr:GGDEF domain-containing protein [Pseudomonas sp. OIL-1]QIB51685.1 GGDEF domain-containing protein [Pseudomonas sp. OIL-1]